MGHDVFFFAKLCFSILPMKSHLISCLRFVWSLSYTCVVTWFRCTAVKAIPNLTGIMAMPRFFHLLEALNSLTFFCSSSKPASWPHSFQHLQVKDASAKAAQKLNEAGCCHLPIVQLSSLWLK